MAKVRLVKGPHAGKVVEVSGPAGMSFVQIAGPKQMSRKQRYEWERDNRLDFFVAGKTPTHFGGRPFPTVRAEYKLAMTYYSGQHVPCQHPDGSYFYTYVEGTKKEF